MKTIEENVRWLMDTFSETRNFPATEFYKYYLMLIDHTVHVEDIKTDPESILRCRRKLVEKFPKYAPDSKVKIAKMQKEEDVKEYART